MVNTMLRVFCTKGNYQKRRDSDEKKVITGFRDKKV